MGFRELLTRLHNILSDHDRRRIYFLFLVFFIASVVEVIGFGSIAPFVAVISDKSWILHHPWVRENMNSLWFFSEENIVFTVGFTSLSLVILTNLVGYFNMVVTNKISYEISGNLTSRLFCYYLRQNYDFFMRRHSTVLMGHINHQLTRLTHHILIPSLQLFSRFCLLSLILMVLSALYPLVTFVAVVVMGVACFLLLLKTRAAMARRSVGIVQGYEERDRIMQECFENIKVVKMNSKETFFTDRFECVETAFIKAHLENQISATSPRFFLEALSIVGVITLGLVWYRLTSNPVQVVAVLSVMGLAGYRLLPSVQQVIYNISLIKGNLASFDAVYEDLTKALEKSDPSMGIFQKRGPISLRITDMTYSYAEAKKPALQSINFSVERGDFIGIVGRSGAGKSTLLDILCGLLTPCEGVIEVDDEIVDWKHYRIKAGRIGYVPQNVILLDLSLAENIALGVEKEKIDLLQVQRAIEWAGLKSYVNHLEKDIWTQVGEKGGRLSGGQRQRIGLARALYYDPDLLILDEVTSALDAQSENEIVSTIRSLKGRVTVVAVSHRMNTIQFADKIYIMKNGQITGTGCHQALMQNYPEYNDIFSGTNSP